VESDTNEGTGPPQKDGNADMNSTWNSWSVGATAKKAPGKAQPKGKADKERLKDKSDPGSAPPSATEKLEIEGESEVLARAASATGHYGEDTAELEALRAEYTDMFGKVDPLPPPPLPEIPTVDHECSALRSELTALRTSVDDLDRGSLGVAESLGGKAEPESEKEIALKRENVYLRALMTSPAALESGASSWDARACAAGWVGEIRVRAPGPVEISMTGNGERFVLAVEDAWRVQDSTLGAEPLQVDEAVGLGVARDGSEGFVRRGGAVIWTGPVPQLIGLEPPRVQVSCPGGFEALLA
jgi:hypothetical protein